MSTRDDLEQCRRRLRHVATRLARISHDLNNPIAIVSANAQILLQMAGETDLDEELRATITDIVEAADLMAESVEQLAELKDLLLEHSAPDS